MTAPQSFEPLWEPLIAVVGEARCPEFMFMFTVEAPDGSPLHCYKHAETRRYLNLTDDGRAFRFAEAGLYVPREMSEALSWALGG